MSFLIRLLANISSHSENDSQRKISLRSSNNHFGIIKSSLFLLKYSKLKLLDILLALCISPIMALRLYLVRIFEDTCTGSFFDLL